MGKRGKDPAIIPPGIQDLVNATLSRYGRGQPITNRPMASPARSKAAPPQVNQVPATPAARAEPATPASTPLKEPTQKKYRSIASIPSSESLPRLPSFSESSQKTTPRHSDTQTTIATDVLDDMARLRISGASSESLQESQDAGATQVELQCSVCFMDLLPKQGFEKDGQTFCGAECMAWAKSDKARAAGHVRAGLLISDNGSIESIGESLRSQRSEESVQSQRSGESVQSLRSEESVDQGQAEPPQKVEPDPGAESTLQTEYEDTVMHELEQQLLPESEQQLPPSVPELVQQLPPSVPGDAKSAEPNPDTQAQVDELKEQLRATQEMLEMLLSPSGVSTSSTINDEAVRAMLQRAATQEIDAAAAKAGNNTPPASTPVAKACEKIQRFGLITKAGMKQLFESTTRTATNPPDSDQITDAAAVEAPTQTAAAKAPALPQPERATAPDPAPSSIANPAPSQILPATAKAPALPQPERATAPDPAPSATASAAPSPIPPATAEAPALPEPNCATVPDPAPSAPPTAKSPNCKAPPAPPMDPKPPTQAESAVPPGRAEAPAPTPPKAPQDSQAPAPTPPKASPADPAGREETSEDRAAREEQERLKKQAHADWMRFNRSLRHPDVPDEVWEKAFRADGKPRQRPVLRHLFEIFVSSNENWLESSIVLNSRKKLAKRRRGKFVWVTVEDLIKKHGESTALQIKSHKVDLDPNCSGIHWMKHPDVPEREDWQLVRVFDGKMETTESDSEEDHIFEMGGTLTGKGAARTGAALLGLSGTSTGSGGGSAGADDVALKGKGKGKGKTNRNTENTRTTPKAKAKPPSKLCLDLVSKGALKTVDADSLFQQCIQGNVTATYANALIKDAKPAIDEMKQALSALQGQIGKVNDETLDTLNTNADKAMKAYDEAVAAIKRSIAVHKPKPAKTKKAA